MKRRHFLELTGAALAMSVMRAHANPSQPLDAAAYRATRRFADLSFGRIAYVERGAGATALFLHGAPLNGFQWRGAIERLAARRRGIAPDFMGLGYSEIPEHQSLAADAQAAMLAAFLDARGPQGRHRR